MALKLQELRNTSIERLVELYDHFSSSWDGGAEYYLGEIHRRDQDKQTRTMLRLTIWITIMTGIMTLATIVNIYLVVKLTH